MKTCRLAPGIFVLVPVLVVVGGAAPGLAQCTVQNSVRLVNGGGNAIVTSCFDSPVQPGGGPLASSAHGASSTVTGESHGDFGMVSGYGWLGFQGSMGGTIFQAGNGVFCIEDDCHGPRAQFSDTITLNSATLPLGTPVMVRQRVRLVGGFVLSEAAATHSVTVDGVGINNGGFSLTQPGESVNDFMVSVGIPHTISARLSCAMGSGVLSGGASGPQSYSADFWASMTLELLTTGITVSSCGGGSYALCSQLTIAASPSDTSACGGQTVTLSVSITSPGPAVYQWRKNGSLVDRTLNPSAGTATLVLTGTTPADAGNYDCVVTNGCGAATSSHAHVFVNTADFDGDGDFGTDFDIQAFFACLGGTCCATCGTSDFNGDGDFGTDRDIESFFSVLGGSGCVY